MEFSQYTIRGIVRDDWIMVPPGNGRHRGESEDSGILVVTHVDRRVDYALIDGYDMVTGLGANAIVDNFQHFIVVEA